MDGEARGRKRLRIAAAVADLNHAVGVAAKEPAKDKLPKTDAGTTINSLGLTLSNITPELKEKFSLSDDNGVVVVDVSKDGPAAEKGLKAGDVIMEAAQEEIKSATQVAGKIDDAKRSGRKSILLLVERQGDLRFIALRLDKS